VHVGANRSQFSTNIYIYVYIYIYILYIYIYPIQGIFDSFDPKPSILDPVWIHRWLRFFGRAMTGKSPSPEAGWWSFAHFHGDIAAAAQNLGVGWSYLKFWSKHVKKQIMTIRYPDMFVGILCHSFLDISTYWKKTLQKKELVKLYEN